LARFAYIKIKHDILNISPFITLHGYNSAIFWDVENDIFKRKTPAAKKRVEEILIIKE